MYYPILFEHLTTTASAGSGQACFVAQKVHFLLLVSIHAIKASRCRPEDQIATTILCRHVIGSAAHASSNFCPKPWPSSVIDAPVTSSESSLPSQSSGALTEDILLSTCWTVILIVCGKHMILLPFASNENISRSMNSFSKNSNIVSFIVRLSKVQWPDCIRTLNQ